VSITVTKFRSFATLWEEDLGEMPSFAAGGILPKGAFFLFGGETGIGKSLLMLNIMDRLMGPRPGHWPGRPDIELTDVPQRALYLDAEIGEWGLWDRTKKIWTQAPPRGFVYATDTAEMTIDTEPGRKRLLDLVLAAQPEIVIIDPVSSFMSGSDSDNSAVADFFRSLRWIQEKAGPITFLLSHHFRKKPQEKQDYDPLDMDNFRGASKWMNEAWSVLTMKSEDLFLRKVVARWAKVRNGPHPSGDFRWRYDENHRLIETPSSRTSVFSR